MVADFLEIISGLFLEASGPKVAAMAAGFAVAVGLMFLSAAKSRLIIRPGRRIAMAVVASILLFLFCLCIAGFGYTQKVRDVGVVLLADTSESIPDPELARAREWIEAAYRAKGDNWVRTVAFARKPEILEGRGEVAPEVGRLDQTPGTDIARAMAAALELFPEGVAPRSVILTDGNQTDGDALAQAAVAASRGVTLHAVELNTRTEPDVFIESLHLPASARSGERVRIGVDIFSNFATEAEVTLTQGKRRLFSKTLELAPGRRSVVAQDVAVGASSKPVTAEVKAEDDRHPENNLLSAAIHVKSLPRVLLISGHVDEDLPVVEVLEKARLRVRVAGIEAVPARPGPLAAYDVVLLSDVPYLSLSENQQDALLDYSENGGGVLVLGGANTGQLGKKKELPIRRMMPVDFKEKKKTEPNPISLILILDKSASMSRQKKFAMAVLAACDTIDLMPEKSRIGVLLFDDFPRWAIPLQDAGDAESASA